jgi:hypothetical protein
VRLRLFRRSADGWAVVSESSDLAPKPALDTAFPARIPVDGGETVGLRLSATGDTPATFEAPPGNVTGTWVGDPARGEDAGAPLRSDGRRVNVAVRLESDHDADGLGDDTQDADDDADGLSDAREAQLGTNPENSDSDGDGVIDGLDGCLLTGGPSHAGPHPGETCDSDGDGVSDDAEAFLRTSRLDADSDDDGLSDGVEERRGTDARRVDTDRDGLADGLEAGARLGVPDPPGTPTGTDQARFRRDRDPRTRTDAGRRDSDRDGLLDGREDRNHNGRRERTETDPSRRDTDGDAVPDGRERFPLDPRR